VGKSRKKAKPSDVERRALETELHREGTYLAIRDGIAATRRRRHKNDCRKLSFTNDGPCTCEASPKE
jgi:hypothetical protein